jgi:glycosyltransferase involved in cell wall biosynthesis
MRGREFRCRLVGDGGAEREKTECLVRDLGLSDRVELAGALSAADVAAEYRRADLMVLASVREGFGMALVEAQLCGCPVVGVRSGGMTDIIEDGVTGFLAEPDNAADLAEVLGRALADTDGRQRIARQGMEAARTKFSAAAVTARFVEWYEGLA